MRILLFLIVGCVGCSVSGKKIETPDQYANAIRSHVSNHVHTSDKKYKDLICTVELIQDTDGNIQKTTFSDCNVSGLELADLEQRIVSASPLPVPDESVMYEEKVRISFKQP